MSTKLENRQVAFLAADGVEQAELTEPWQAVEEAGGRPVLVSLESGTIQAHQHLDKGDEFEVDIAVADADPSAFDGLVIPGGVANPDFLRGDDAAVAFARAFVEADRPTAVICHGPWVLAEADVVRGRRVTSWPTVSTDLRNAGADWVDEEVVKDGNLVTSRKPEDLPAFCAALVETVAAAEPVSSATR
jgi:protease I